nr:hypothetical protein GCM10020092_083530 [Actinoplanes digitatis]
MTERKAIETWLTDMDGVLVHEGVPVPGAPEFVNRMKSSGKPFLILTNNSIYTPRDLQARLSRMGFDVPEQSIWTAALATAQFLARPAARRHGLRHRRGLPPPRCTPSATCSPTTRRTTWCSARPGPTASRRSPRRSA